ncbi:MAG: thiamine pyrophosphate-dependent dehydrogenase E1 component subunit alpha [Ectothiorhodospiraceae bacterium]|nr:thiamine pyrophosphate-dependent dehydrogenase E1 component subunit alpha [Ectothiorhodospiraceae bacterium]
MSLSADLCLRMYRDMWRIRVFEEEASRQTGLGTVQGALHMYCGEEAVAVGVCANLRPDDYLLGTHRSHGHCLAKGAEMDRMMAELFGKAEGSCGGKGGSMHIADLSLNILGANGIVAGGIGPATGTGLATKIRGTDQVSVCFFGDGASARGTFHEGLLFGSLWKLPVIYVCENNQYQQWVARKNVAVVDSVADMAASYAMPGVSVDGQDVTAVYAAAGEAVERARSGGGPTLIEARTYRFHGHSLGDRQEYRSEAEVEHWRQNRDPIKLLAAYMRERQWLGDREDAEIQSAVNAEVEASVAYAHGCTDPSPEAVTADVLDTAWRVTQ